MNGGGPHGAAPHLRDPRSLSQPPGKLSHVSITLVALAAGLAACVGALVAWLVLRAATGPAEPVVDPADIAAEQVAALQHAFRDALGALQQQSAADREA